MISRETAYRVFASEFSSSSLDLKEEGEKSPAYVVTPLGAKVNRLMIVGIAFDKKMAGTEEDPQWRVQVSDGTGTFYIYAGKYSPEALQTLSSLETPCMIAVVGKCRTYRPQEGTLYISVRPESIAEVSPELRDYWVIETAKATMDRIDRIEQALGMDDRSKKGLMSKGIPEVLADGISSAIEHYGSIDTNKYRGMLLEILEQISSEGGIVIPESEEYSAPDEFELDDEEPSESEEKAPENPAEGGMDDKQKEALILDVIASLDTAGKGAPLADIIKEAAKSGIGESELEEITVSLLDKGLVYEPTVSRMKRI